LKIGREKLPDRLTFVFRQRGKRRAIELHARERKAIELLLLTKRGRLAELVEDTTRTEVERRFGASELLLIRSLLRRIKNEDQHEEQPEEISFDFGAELARNADPFIGNVERLSLMSLSNAHLIAVLEALFAELRRRIGGELKDLSSDAGGGATRAER
jgi:hypothetical protein